MELRFVYITTENSEEARRIGRTLVEERLAACVNILDGMLSIYWWEGEIQDDRETVLIAKTRERRRRCQWSSTGSRPRRPRVRPSRPP